MENGAGGREGGREGGEKKYLALKRINFNYFLSKYKIINEISLL
jgi:hypothetical protein